MTGRLEGKVAFIAGASEGIGRATAKRMAAEGALVVVASRRAEVLNELVREIEADGGAAEAAVLDVSKLDDYAAVLRGVAQRHGHLDVLVHNAMSGRAGVLNDITLDDWRENMLVNADACFIATQEAVRIMAPQRKGSIINIASIGGMRSARGHISYGASKAALIHFSASAAVDAGASNIRVNVVVPGLIDTQTMRDGMAFSGNPNVAQEAAAKIPLGRFGTPEELANAVLFLASDEASFITGVALLVDGGKYPTL
jgi:meso-butanediol dehydrogenase/(S,S)-butanediol dehydrogenase/diacetyl reductase